MKSLDQILILVYLLSLIVSTTVSSNTLYDVLSYQSSSTVSAVKGNLNECVPDCNCTVGAVWTASRDYLSPLLTQLTELTFFRYFFVDLEKPCPFWQDDGQCMMEGCSVCTCDENEIPLPWRHVDKTALSETNIDTDENENTNNK